MESQNRKISFLFMATPNRQEVVRLFLVFLLFFILIAPCFLYASDSTPPALKEQLAAASGQQKLEIWKNWYKPYLYKKPELWEYNLDAACGDAQSILPPEAAQKWCFDLHLALQKKYAFRFLKNRSDRILAKAKTLIPNKTADPGRHNKYLKFWFIAAAEQDYLKSENIDSAFVFLEEAQKIDTGISQEETNFYLNKTSTRLFLYDENFSSAAFFFDKAKQNMQGLDLEEQTKVEMDILELSVKKYRNIAQVGEVNYLDLLESSSQLDSSLIFDIKTDYADYLSKTNQNEKAEALMKSIFKEINPFLIYKIQEPFMLVYIRYLTKVGNFKEAKAMTKQLRIYFLNICEIETAQILREQKEKFELAKKREDIKREQKEKELLYSNFIKKAAYIGGFGSLILGLLSFLFLKGKNKRKKLSLLQEQDQAINAYRNRLFSSITADIKGPLNKMMVPMQRAANRDEPINVKADIEMAQRNGHRLLELFNQIQDWNNLEASGLSVQLSKDNLLQKVNDIALRFGAQATSKNIEFISDFSFEDLDYELDYEKVNRIFSNLIGNAIKFCEAGQSIHFKATEIEQGIKFTVQDNGPGITKEDQKRLFDRLFQGKQGQLKGGTGIGLATVKEMVELMGGAINFESKVGQGTAFFINLPCKKMASPKVSSVQNNQPVVLVVEDDQELLGFLASALSKNYTVLKASNTKDGYDLAQQEVPDFILSDWNLPDNTGGWLCQQIKQNELTTHIPIMILTGLTNADHLKEVFDSGAIARMEKPFKLDALELQVKNILQQQKLIKVKWTNLEQKNTQIEQKPPSLLDRFQLIILENMADEQFSVEKLANLLSLSKVQLLRKIKSTTGKTPNQLLKEARLEKSRDLLQNSDQSIADIAYAVGYSDPNNFSTAYKKYFKVSPSGSERDKSFLFFFTYQSSQYYWPFLPVTKL